MGRQWRLFVASVVAGMVVVAGVTGLVVALSAWQEGRESPPPTPASAAPEATPDTPSGRPEPRRTPSPSASAEAPEPAPSHPVRKKVSYAFPVEGCAVSYAAEHHNYPATDIFAAEGCAFVSPVAGVVDEVGTVDRWSASDNRGADRGGKFVSVVGVDGVRYYGSHLSAVAPGIRPGVRVQEGVRLGSVGETGSARGTGPHVHFGISWPGPPDQWWVRRGVVAPAPFLDAWRAGRNASPVAAVAEAERRLGPQSGECRQYC